MLLSFPTERGSHANLDWGAQILFHRCFTVHAWLKWLLLFQHLPAGVWSLETELR